MEDNSAMIATSEPSSLAPKYGLLGTLLLSSILLTILLSLIYLLNPTFIRFINLKLTDIIVATTTNEQPQLEVIIVDIDEASLQRFGQWPWPRHRFAKLLQKVKDKGAATIGVNILFPEKDRTSPEFWSENVAKELDITVNTSNIPQELRDFDSILAETIANGPFVLGYKFFWNDVLPSDEACHLHPVSIAYRETGKSDTWRATAHQAEGVICNHSSLANASRYSGFLNGTPDIDGVLRSLPLFIEFEGQLYPSFAMAVLMNYHQNSLPILYKDRGFVSWVKLGQLDIPTDNRGNFLLGPRTPTIANHISAADLLTDSEIQTSMENKIVLVGLSASGLDQSYPTPVAASTYLLDLHKYSIESMHSPMQSIRIPLFLGYEVLISMILCIILAIAFRFLSTTWTISLGLVLLLLTWGAIKASYEVSGYLLSPLLPTVSAMLGFSLLIILKYRYIKNQAMANTENALLLLTSSESSLKSILHTIPDIIFRLDKRGKITFISPAISKYSRNTKPLLGRSIFQIVAPEDFKKAKYKINERRTGSRATVNLELRLLLARDEDPDTEAERYFSISAEGIYQNSKPSAESFSGTQGIVRDITDKKRLENQLIQAQKMEVIGNLAAGIAHDLNNILSGLVSYPDLLLLDIPKNNPLREKISLIQKSGQKAATIVQDLLSLARRNIDFEHVCNINDIISEYLNSADFKQIQAISSGIEITTNLQPDLLNIHGSNVHLSKVIMNGVYNALEAMPMTGGSINIRTANAYIDAIYSGFEDIPEGEYVITSIADDGIGISPEDLKKVFDPFYTKKSQERSGTGLGMTIIWATVKDHGGYIDIHSQEGEGTTLSMYLPATRDKIKDRQSRAVLDDYIGSETILIVDDMQAQLEIAGNMLTKLGYTVFTAASGNQALDIIRRQPVDLVVLDMIMPGELDGLKTYAKILELYPHQKAIITSGFSESERVTKLQQMGTGQYVQKPYTMEQLGMAVREELNRERFS